MWFVWQQNLYTFLLYPRACERDWWDYLLETQQELFPHPPRSQRWSSTWALAWGMLFHGQATKPFSRSPHPLFPYLKAEGRTRGHRREQQHTVEGSGSLEHHKGGCPGDTAWRDTWAGRKRVLGEAAGSVCWSSWLVWPLQTHVGGTASHLPTPFGRIATPTNPTNVWASLTKQCLHPWRLNPENVIPGGTSRKGYRALGFSKSFCLQMGRSCVHSITISVNVLKDKY